MSDRASAASHAERASIERREPIRPWEEVCATCGGGGEGGPGYKDHVDGRWVAPPACRDCGGSGVVPSAEGAVLLAFLAEHPREMGLP
ncbi:MAG: hypothetical protein WD739_09175 [Actinomycetota bacterium]